MFKQFFYVLSKILWQWIINKLIFFQNRKCQCRLSRTIMDNFKLHSKGNLRSPTKYYHQITQVWLGSTWITLNKKNTFTTPYLGQSTISRSVTRIGLNIRHLKFEREVIDRNGVLSSVVLKHACEERLCEVKSWQPKYYGSIKFYPIIKELQSATESANYLSYNY